MQDWQHCFASRTLSDPHLVDSLRSVNRESQQRRQLSGWKCQRQLTKLARLSHSQQVTAQTAVPARKHFQQAAHSLHNASVFCLPSRARGVHEHAAACRHLHTLHVYICICICRSKSCHPAEQEALVYKPCISVTTVLGISS